MRQVKSFIILAVLILTLISVTGLFSGCAGRRNIHNLSMEDAWARIKAEFEDEDYLDVTQMLEIFIINYAGTNLADSAQYLLAESHFELGEYIISGSEYQKLITQYPRSPLVEEAEYKLGLSYYELSPAYSKDQEYTEKALNMFQLFIEDFPNSHLAEEAETRINELRNKLAKKDYRAGRLYHKMTEYTSARIYYQSVLDNYYDSVYADDSQYFKARSWMDQERWEEAIAAFRAFISRYPDSEYSGRVKRDLNEAEENYRKQLEKQADEQEQAVFDVFDDE